MFILSFFNFSNLVEPPAVMMRSVLALVSLSVVLVNAQAPTLQIQIMSPALETEGRQGCISASDNVDGAPVVFHDCNTEDLTKHSWVYQPWVPNRVSTPSGPQPIKVFGDKCLDVKDGANNDGAELQIWSCVPGSTNQQWISNPDLTFNWAGTDKCIDLTDGSIADGNQLQLWTCAAQNDNQKFWGKKVPNTRANRLVSPAVPLIAFHLRSLVNKEPMCMSATNDADGASVVLAECRRFTDTAPANQTWVYAAEPLSGPIKTYGGTKCLDVPNGDATNGNRLQIRNCVEGDANQQWKRRSPFPNFTIEWVGKNKCVDITNGDMTVGNSLQISDCDASSEYQTWWLFDQ
ncbi:hypothetical protein AAF712_015960 [Marasmius tenuissimus]|uniref:Ricin B lectin domain-containing protein n=1 Tax=Marasmius tenuissimus TaxID=585030 RepID=A0ABR2Z8R9_9AGAR